MGAHQVAFAVVKRFEESVDVDLAAARPGAVDPVQAQLHRLKKAEARGGAEDETEGRRVKDEE